MHVHPIPFLPCKIMDGASAEMLMELQHSIKKWEMETVVLIYWEEAGAIQYMPTTTTKLMTSLDVLSMMEAVIYKKAGQQARRQIKMSVFTLDCLQSRFSGEQHPQ